MGAKFIIMFKIGDAVLIKEFKNIIGFGTLEIMKITNLIGEGLIFEIINKKTGRIYFKKEKELILYENKKNN